MKEVDERIDDIEYANYNIPTLQHGQRVLVQRDNLSGVRVYQHTELDYVDARLPKAYPQPNVEFNATLNVEQLDRLSMLNVLMRSLLHNKSVTGKQMVRVLTEVQYRTYIESLEAQQHTSEIQYADGVPTTLHRYQAKLKAADFQYNKFEKMSARARNSAARYKDGSIQQGHYKAEKLYEEALECLEEIYNTADGYERNQLQLWMDRELDFDAGAERKVGISPITIPRVRGSRSSNALDSGLPKLSKRLKSRLCQLQVLKIAAWQLAFRVEDEKPEQEQLIVNSKLKALLQLNGDDDDL